MTQPRLPVVNGIMISGRRRGAIIDGSYLHAGDTIDGYEIVAVLEDGVRLHRQRQGQRQRHDLDVHLARAGLQIRKPATPTEPPSGGELR